MFFFGFNRSVCRITVHLHKRTLYIPIHPAHILGLQSPDDLHKRHTLHNTRKTNKNTYKT